MPGLGGVRGRPMLTALLAEADHKRAAAAAYIEQGKLRYSGLSRWLTKHTRNKLASLHLISLPTEDEVVEQATQLCKEYVLQRLRLAELLPARVELLIHTGGGCGRDLDGEGPPTPSSTVVSQELQAAGAELESMYPDLYDSVTLQLEVTLQSEADAHRTLCAVAKYLYKGNITWGKIVAGLSITAALACDCVRQEHPEYVKHVIEAFTKITREHTAQWIIQQGGWADVIQACRTNNEAPLLWAFSVIGATIGFSLTLLATVNV